jgi:two-component system chemotaxis response regulator CheB
MANPHVQAVVIGGSAGALEVLGSILSVLPHDFALPIALVVHLPPTRPSYLAEVLGARCALKVKEAEDKAPFEAGMIHVAPPNYHLLIEAHGCLALSVDEPVLYSRPAIDVLFESAADAYGPAVAGVLLSGASEDGARGLARIAKLGGTTIVQAPDTAAAPAMPEAALRLCPVRHVLRIDALGPALVALAAHGAASREAG